MPEAHWFDCFIIAEQEKEQMNAKSGHARKCEPKKKDDSDLPETHWANCSMVK